MRPALGLSASFLLAFATVPALAADPSVSAGDVTVRYDSAARSLAVLHREAGVILDRIAVKAKVGGREVSSDDAALTPSVAADAARGELVLALPGALTVKATVRDGEVEFRAEGNLDGAAALAGRAGLGPDALPAILQAEAAADRGVLVTTLGPAVVPGARSLFGPLKDFALTAGPADRARWERHGSEWTARASAPAGEVLLALRLHPHYYRDTLGIRYYAPIRKPPRWPTAPVVAMTWYGIEGWNGRPAQRKDWLFPQVDWVAEHLLPYGGPNLVFQLDDNYPENDDKAMRELSDYIRSKGLVPGIWFTPFTVAPKAEAHEHPEWFLHDKDGKLIATFGGVNWGGNLTLNATNAQAVEAWYGAWWRKAGETWNFDFFKIDGQPEVAAAYRASADGGGDEGYRQGLQIGRAVVGPDKFVNACWGTPVEAVGLVNGSRIGGDTGNDPHAIHVVLEWNFLNNVAWYSDPDAAANLYKATAERARLNAQARVLTGQQFLTDDVWTKVPPQVCRVWQCSFPSLDIHPANLYPIKEWRRYDLFDLRVAKPWGTWDVVGVFNYDGRPAEKVLDLGRLPLEAPEVHLFEYWASTYLGRFPRDAKIPLALAAYEGKLLSIVPAADDRPVLISTSRHLSQGGLDLEEVAWKRDGERWMASGKSSHLVKGDPYELVFASGRYVAADAGGSAPMTRPERAGGVTRVAIQGSGQAEWNVTFEPCTGPWLDLAPLALDLAPGAGGRVEVRSIGPKPARFRLASSDPRVHLAPAEGDLGPWPAKVDVAVSADVSGVDPGKPLEATVTLEAQGGHGPERPLRVRAWPPRPENLAAGAKASASSVWGEGYEAPKAIDGDPSTRWNSRQGDKDGCWIELAWDKPVRFDRVVIDECMDFGPRIQAWKLLAGSEEPAEVAQGKEMGPGRAVSLARPVEAKRLRLVIEKASVVPTIWEIEVQCVRKAP